MRQHASSSKRSTAAPRFSGLLHDVAARDCYRSVEGRSRRGARQRRRSALKVCHHALAEAGIRRCGTSMNHTELLSCVGLARRTRLLERGVFDIHLRRPSTSAIQAVFANRCPRSSWRKIPACCGGGIAPIASQGCTPSMTPRGAHYSDSPTHHSISHLGFQRTSARISTGYA